MEIETLGEPIIGAACYCDDCQAAGRELEALPGAPMVLDKAGGTAFLLFRKDRVKCVKGEPLLRDRWLKEGAPSRRVLASCCNSFMFLEFQKGHWFSLCRARFEGEAPPLQLRILTKFKAEGAELPPGLPAYPTFPFKFVAKLILARLAMLLPSRAG
ncbi:hypothetical protein PVT67_14155 [Gallaecimonas kandeliae]|uniref:GFA family protein n=1 Tax=Gallaecimonas kandeliae TaxID=3029055 RepID=UPI002648F786|nr:hypothetical protein [Gallaecimonas kandeliae]WKE64797.1 hypothetical protein PVT67_14155 [Gallaecimonas kandeliae]